MRFSGVCFGVALSALGILTGCGGGGGSVGTTSALPQPPTKPASQKMNATATITIPPRHTSADRRHPQWISPSTTYVDFTAEINGVGVAYAADPVGTSVPGCSGSPLVCTVSYQVVPGPQTMVVNLWDATPNSGNILATTTQNITAVAGTSNTFNYTLNGVPALFVGFPATGPFTPFISPFNFTAGTPNAQPLQMAAQDADGNTISGNIDGPINTASDDSTGGFTITPAQITTINPSMTFSYNGNANTASTMLFYCSTVFTATNGPTGCFGLIQLNVNTLSQTIYVSNPGAATPGIVAFAPGASGNVAPVRTIPAATHSPNLRSPFFGGGGPPGAVTVDFSGDAYWTNPTTNGMTFAAYGAGNSSPISLPFFLAGTLGPLTTLNQPAGIGLDNSNQFYIANTGNASITVFQLGQPNHAPVATISGASTNLIAPVGVALDASNNIYVTDTNRILEFSAGSNGNVLPIATIAGGSTQLSNPTGIAFNNVANQILVANSTSSQITAYAGGSNGNVLPAFTLSGPLTTLSSPNGVAVDAAQNIYVANTGGNSILEFNNGSTGNVAPNKTISGGNTTLSGPVSVFIRP